MDPTLDGKELRERSGEARKPVRDHISFHYLGGAPATDHDVNWVPTSTKLGTASKATACRYHEEAPLSPYMHSQS